MPLFCFFLFAMLVDYQRANILIFVKSDLVIHYPHYRLNNSSYKYTFL
jgi:hypothetical protein